MGDKNNETEIDVKELFYLLINKIWLIFMLLAAGCLVSWAISKYLIQPVFTSTAKVYVINKQKDSNLTLSDLQSGEQLTKDYMILVKSRPVVEQVINNLNLSVSIDTLSDQIRVSTPENTRILEISVRNHNPETAKKIADSIAEVSAERMVTIMGAEKVNIMEYGNLPEDPSSPNIARNTVLGGAAGAIIVSLIIILIYLANDSVRTTEDIENYLGVTALGILPLDGNINNNFMKNIQKRKLFGRKRKSSVA